MYFCLLRILSSFFFATHGSLASWSASRHHGSAFSDCLHADGCRDYARYFRFCTTDRSVSFPSLHTSVHSIQTVDTLTSEMCSVAGQYFASTMVIVGMSVVATVIVLQFHHHNPNSGHMPRWVSYKVFYNINPKQTNHSSTKKSKNK